MKKDEPGEAEMPEIEIFRAGDYPQQGSFGEADIDKIVENYDPKNHEAPLVLDHIPGPAYGWVDSIRRVGRTLKARVRQLAPGFIEAVRAGRYKKISTELWANLKGRGLSLKRVAFLGAVVPEIKGLAPVEFADGGESITIEQEEEMEKEEPTKGKEPAVKMFSEADLQKVIADERTKIFAEMTVKLDEMKGRVDELSKRAEQAESRLQEQQTARMKDEIHLFCEGLMREGVVIPAMQEMGLEAFMSSLDRAETLTFAEGKSGTQLDWFKGFLGGLSKMVPLGEFKFPAGSRTSRKQQAINSQLGISNDDVKKFGERKE